MQMLTDNWIVAAILLVVAALVAWWLIAANRKTAITRDIAADEGPVAPARRNQALIDSAPAAAVPPVTPTGLAGVGAAVSAAADPASQRDDLKRIKGLGPKVEAVLHGMGVTTYAEIAGWSDADIDRIDAQLGPFAGRIRRDDWPAQARLLAEGDTAAYENKFGRL